MPIRDTLWRFEQALRRHEGLLILGLGVGQVGTALAYGHQPSNVPSLLTEIYRNFILIRNASRARQLVILLPVDEIDRWRRY